ncbi:MAG: T9SS type A sorting domain-containing protein [Candidatus Limimorpha sp.]
MKRKFSILIAALAAILLITPPHLINKAQGQNEYSATLTWSEQGLDNSTNVNNTPYNVGDYFSVTCTKNGATTNPTYYTSGTSVRCYATKGTNNGNVITVNTNDAGLEAGVYILSVEYTGTHNKQGTTSFIYSGNPISTTTIKATYSEESKTQTASATLCETGGSKNGQFYFASITIQYAFSPSSPTITLSPETLDGFSYFVGGGPSDAQSFTLQGSNLTEDVTLTATENYEICNTSDGEYLSSLSYAADEIADAQTVYVRLKAGLGAGNYEGTITATSEGAEDKTISLSGTVYQEYNYLLNINGDNIVAALKVDGTELGANAKIEFGKEVTVVVVVDDGYTYLVSVTNNTTGEAVEVTDDKFTMPASDITVTVTERALQNFTITYYVNGVVSSTENVLEGNTATLPTESEITVPEGFNFVGWTENEETAVLISEPFIPAGNTNLYLIFEKYEDVYDKVTKLEDITTGTYIIVNANYCMPNLTTDAETPPSKDSIYMVNEASSTDRYYSVPNNTEWTFTGNNTEMTITNSDGNYLYATNANNGIRVYTTSDTWAFETNGTGFSMKEKNNSRYCATYKNGNDWRSYTSKTYTNYDDYGILYLFKKKKDIISYITRVYDVTTTSEMENIPPTAVVNVPNGVVFTLTGTNQGTANNLIIEDGGQLIVNNSGVMATFKKSIEATQESKATEGGWYSIASPVKDVAISSVTNLVDNADHSLRYNLYRYDEPTSVWQAYNTTNHSDFTTLANGQGYLYRNNGMELSFAGEVNQGDVTVNLTNSATNTELKGFNLIGNPFGHNIYKGTGAAIDNANLSEGFYYLTNNGEWLTGDVSKAISPKMGILVQVTGEVSGVELTISDNNTNPSETRYANDNLRFTVSNNEYQDVAYAKFSKGNGLNKISHRNPEVPMLYIPQNGERYAIATMKDNTEVFALNFKAATMGRYTLGYNAEGEYSYLHVIDRLTGDDVDMLLEGEYSFTASPKDNENRFIVRLAYKPDYSEENNETFVYQSGDEILVSGEGELQIFDVTGRLVTNMSINGAESLNINTRGVYIFRLVGNDVKTQKIVVK